jgi:hypothetical protein
VPGFGGGWEGHCVRRFGVELCVVGWCLDVMIWLLRSDLMLVLVCYYMCIAHSHVSL